MKYSSLIYGIEHLIPDVLVQLQLNEREEIRVNYVHHPGMQFLDIPVELLKLQPNTLLDYIHPEDRVSFKQSLIQSAKQHQNWKWHGRLVDTQNVYYYTAHCIPTQTPEGQWVWNGLLRDVSEEIKSKQQHTQQQTYYDTILKRIHDVVWTAELPTGVPEYLNQNFEQLTGYTATELGRHFMNFIEIVHPEDQQTVFDAVERAMQDGYAEAITRMLCKNGTVKWIQHTLWVHTDAQQTTHRMDGIMRDITSIWQEENEHLSIQQWLNQVSDTLNQANTSLEESLTRAIQQVAALSSIPSLHICTDDGIFMEPAIEFFWDSNSPDKLHKNYMHANERALSEQLKQVFDKKTIFFFNTTDVEDAYQPYLKARNIQSACLLPLKRNDESIGCMLIPDNEHQLRKHPLQLNALKIMASLVANRLALEHKNQNLVRAKDMAETAARTKSDFLSLISHEIRTPLNGIVGLTYHLLQEMPKPEQVETLQALRFSAENLLTLVNDVLDFSKIEAGKLELEQIQFQLSDLVTGIKQSFQSRAEEKGIRIRSMIETGVPTTFMGDPTRLSQILNNLVGNAIKFTEIGTVNIEVELNTQTADIAEITFHISDTGIGIQANDLKHIFNSFTQANSSITRNFGGTGLGLAITKRLVELFGGTIGANSEPQKGSHFYFTIPLKICNMQPEIKYSGDLHSKENKALAGLRILLAEDNAVNVMVARKFFEKWGIIYEVAYDGAVAVEMAQQQPYDIILMDLHMPVKDGYEAARDLRDLGITTPIIALSADAMPNVLQSTLDAGMNDFVTKPFNPDFLFQTLEKYYKS